MSSCIGHGCGLDLMLLWLWCRPVATALIQPLAWEILYAAGVAQRRKKKKKKRKYKVYIWHVREYSLLLFKY